MADPAPTTEEASPVKEIPAQWLSIGQAAKRLGVSIDTLRRWDKKGKLKAIRSPTDRRYYIPKQIEEALEGKFEEKKEEKNEELITETSSEEKETLSLIDEIPFTAQDNTKKLIWVAVISFLAAFILVFLLGKFILGS